VPGLPTGTVTFLYADIVGSTRLLHHLGEERYAQVLTEHYRLLRTAIQSSSVQRAVSLHLEGAASW
jgi:class 3 adenylate cyclase